MKKVNIHADWNRSFLQRLSGCFTACIDRYKPRMGMMMKNNFHTCHALIVRVLRISLVLISVPILIQDLSAQETGEYLERSYIQTGDTLLYRIMYPRHFDESQPYPVVLFLHGRGESGKDNRAQLVHGAKLFRDSIEQYPAIVIFPQCPYDDYWARLDQDAYTQKNRQFIFDQEAEPGVSMRLVMSLMDSLKQLPYIDQSRLYVAGLSMGGMGTWDILWRQRDTYAAAISICGAGPRQLSEIYAETPVWLFHGAKDDVVSPKYSIGLTRGIQQKGGKAKLTLYPDANHNSWDPAFSDPRFLSWLFSHSK